MTDEQFEQRRLCERYNARFVRAPASSKVGIARNVKDGVLPIHGLRIPPDAGTTGWFIWAGGEASEAEDFFSPLHVEHLSEWCPAVIKLLGLPPGWRFLLAEDHEDVWYDEHLVLA